MLFIINISIYNFSNLIHTTDQPNTTIISLSLFTPNAATLHLLFHHHHHPHNPSPPAYILPRRRVGSSLRTSSPIIPTNTFQASYTPTKTSHMHSVSSVPPIIQAQHGAVVDNLEFPFADALCACRVRSWSGACKRSEKDYWRPLCWVFGRDRDLLTGSGLMSSSSTCSIGYKGGEGNAWLHYCFVV